MALRQATAERSGSRGAAAGVGRAVCGPTVEAPRCFLSTLKARFFSSARARLEIVLLTGRPHRGMGSRQRLWMSMQFVGRRLKECPVESGPERARPSRRVATGRRDGQWFERFAEMCQGLISRGRSHPGLRPPANLRFEGRRLLPAVHSAPDVATTPRARNRKLLPQPGHEFGLWRRAVSWEGGLSHEPQQSSGASPPTVCPPTACPPVAASRRLPTCAFVMSRDGRPERVIRDEHPVIAMPVFPRRRHEIGQPAQEVTRRELDDAVSAQPRGLLPAPRGRCPPKPAGGPPD